MKRNTGVKVSAVAATALTFLVIFTALFSGAAFGTMVLVGALHSAVPVVPAIGFGGACWVVTLGMWFRLIFGSSAAKK
ncbi:hypothetical protein [Streptomyces platensis]|uniref:hypothetical protein n=1 Tax=Streptomyces platensis TaxID=58346 RepID=UPI002E275148